MTKVAIVGGAGRVGISFAFDLLVRDLVHHIALVDINQELAEGEALDLTHATSACGNCKITAGGMEECEGADIVVITAGSRRRADESRLALINRNVGILDSTIEKLVEMNRDCLLFIVSNPVDVLTYRALVESGFPRHRVFGLGNVLDQYRFRSLLAREFGWNPTRVQVMVVGEHGDNMVPLYSQAQYDGVRFEHIEGLDMGRVQQIFEETRKSGAEVIRKKGGAGWAVGSAISRVVEAIVKDTRAIMPISTNPDGYLGIKDICLSLPTIVGKNGVEGYFGVKMSEAELAGIHKAAEVLKATYAKIGQEE